jgi:hypothetical protein
MNTLKLNDSTQIVCESKGTRNGFKHEAHLIINGSEVFKQKVCYLNRTWEAYTFQTVALNLVNKYEGFSRDQKEEFKAILENRR